MASVRIASSVKRLLGRVIRELHLYPAIIRAGERPRVAFLNSQGSVQSGLLRAHNIAAGLASHGWASIVIDPSLSLVQRNRLLERFKPDVVVVQQCRHRLNRLEHISKWHFVLDIDDADFLDPKLTPVLESVASYAAAVMAGNCYLRDWALQFNSNVSVVWTGTPLTAAPRPSHRQRAPIITWAQSGPLGYPDELAFCRDIILGVVSRIGPVDFRLYDCEGKENHPVLKDLEAAGVRLQLLPFMKYDQFLASLQQASIGLSPLAGRNFSLGKSFGKILGYIDARVPVICSDSADHGLFFTSQSGVVSNDPDVWVDAICCLLADPDARDRMAASAYDLALSRLSTEAATRQVHEILSQVRLEAVNALPRQTQAQVEGRR